MQHNNGCNLHSVFRDVGSTGKRRHWMEERMGKSGVGGFMVFIKPAMKTELWGGGIIVIYNVPSGYIH
jgi:hypothetical protein